MFENDVDLGPAPEQGQNVDAHDNNNEAEPDYLGVIGEDMPANGLAQRTIAQLRHIHQQLRESGDNMEIEPVPPQERIATKPKAKRAAKAKIVETPLVVETLPENRKVFASAELGMRTCKL